MNNSYFLVGLDVSLSALGYVVAEIGNKKDLSSMSVRSAGCIRTFPLRKKQNISKNEEDCIRINCIVSFLRNEIFDKFHPILAIFAEMPHGGSKSAVAASAMGLAKGAVVASCVDQGVPLFNVSALRVRKVLLNNAKASKAETAEIALEKLPDLTNCLPSKKVEREAALDAAATLLWGILECKGWKTRK